MNEAQHLKKVRLHPFLFASPHVLTPNLLWCQVDEEIAAKLVQMEQLLNRVEQYKKTGSDKPGGAKEGAKIGYTYETAEKDDSDEEDEEAEEAEAEEEEDVDSRENQPTTLTEEELEAFANSTCATYFERCLRSGADLSLIASLYCSVLRVGV